MASPASRGKRVEMGVMAEEALRRSAAEIEQAISASCEFPPDRGVLLPWLSDTLLKSERLPRMARYFATLGHGL